jgi:hypothetical protein
MRKLLIGAALLLAGCGGEASSAEKFKGDQRDVADAVEEIQTAAERRDAEKLCRELLATSLRDKLGRAGSSCDKEIEKAVKDADVFALEVREVAITGTTARVQVRGEVAGKQQTDTLQMVKEDGRWRLSSVGA